MRMAILSAIREPTEIAIRMAMKMEQTGSAIIQPNSCSVENVRSRDTINILLTCIKTAETITPTLPRVSARMWRNTP